ncbi:tektin A isoform X2 [Rhodnius prolixus]|uniref:tektin A isoform X2 n=1 Tax=Rhodnius prolixus TaxID=13249 RepID=UPI003D189D43
MEEKCCNGAGDSKPPDYGGYIQTEKEFCTDERADFLPQMGDKLKIESGKGEDKMEPIGPWATGKVDWSPQGGVTGIRPVVDQYSISRYSASEWRKHNEEVLCSSADDLHRVNMAEYNSRRGLKFTAENADKVQFSNTKRLAERTNEVFKWKEEIKRAIEAMTEEIGLLEMQRKRLSQAKNVLSLVRSISSECLACRALRQGHDLTRDNPEEELIKEAALIKEVDELFNRTLIRVQEQLVRDKAMKLRLESDWSDKKETFECEITNVNLKNDTPTILFKPAATRFNENQSSPEGWENATKELLKLSDAVMAQSCELRALLNGPILQDCIRDLKAQAEKVDVALAKGISDTEDCVKAMFAELEVIARRNAECEKLKYDLANGIRGLDKAMKVAQTRLDNLQLRPRIENCRDKSQYGG